MTLEPKNFVSTAMQEEKEDVLDLHNFQGTLRGQESGKSLSITFPTASVMENILNGSSLSQKLAEFEKSGYLKLFNSQFPLSN